VASTFPDILRLASRARHSMSFNVSTNIQTTEYTRSSESVQQWASCQEIIWESFELANRVFLGRPPLVQPDDLLGGKLSGVGEDNSLATPSGPSSHRPTVKAHRACL